MVVQVYFDLTQQPNILATEAMAGVLTDTSSDFVSGPNAYSLYGYLLT